MKDQETNNFDFSCVLNPAKVVFGRGKIQKLGEEIEQLGIRRPVLIVESFLKQNFSEIIYGADNGSKFIGEIDEVIMHVPQSHAENAIGLVKEKKADGCVAIGGGSAIGLAKAIALDTDLPIIAIPSTYAGSESTPIWGMTKDDKKVTGRDSRVLPKTIIYDPVFLDHLPEDIAHPSALNAAAHCIEAMYAVNGNPIIFELALKGLNYLIRGLKAFDQPIGQEGQEGQEGRELTLVGSWLSGYVLGNVSMAIHHKTCHILGGTYNLPHAQTHAILLPYSLNYNLPSVPKVNESILQIFDKDTGNAAQHLYDFNQKLKIPKSLAEIGFSLEKIDDVVDQMLENPYPNPAPLEREKITQMLRQATLGGSP